MSHREDIAEEAVTMLSLGPEEEDGTSARSHALHKQQQQQFPTSRVASPSPSPSDTTIPVTSFPQRLRRSQTEPLKQKSVSPQKETVKPSNRRLKAAIPNRLRKKDNSDVSPSRGRSRYKYKEEPYRRESKLAGLEEIPVLNRVSSLSSHHTQQPTLLSRRNSQTSQHSGSAARHGFSLKDKIVELEVKVGVIKSRLMLLAYMIATPDAQPASSVPQRDYRDYERRKVYRDWRSDIEEELDLLETRYTGENKPAAYSDIKNQLEADLSLLNALWHTRPEQYKNSSDKTLLDQWVRCSGWINRLMIEQNNMERQLNYYKKILADTRPFISRVGDHLDNELSGNSSAASLHTAVDQYSPGAIPSALRASSLSPTDSALMEDLSPTGPNDVESVPVTKAISNSFLWTSSRTVSPAIFVAAISMGLLIIHQQDVIEVVLQESIQLFFSGINVVIGIVGAIGVILLMIRIFTSDKWQQMFGSLFKSPTPATTSAAISAPAHVIDAASTTAPILTDDSDVFASSFRRYRYNSEPAIDDLDLPMDLPSAPFHSVNSPRHSIFSTSSFVSNAPQSQQAPPVPPVPPAPHAPPAPPASFGPVPMNAAPAPTAYMPMGTYMPSSASLDRSNTYSSNTGYPRQGSGGYTWHEPPAPAAENDDTMDSRPVHNHVNQDNAYHSNGSNRVLSPGSLERSGSYKMPRAINNFANPYSRPQQAYEKAKASPIRAPIVDAYRSYSLRKPKHIFADPSKVVFTRSERDGSMSRYQFEEDDDDEEETEIRHAVQDVSRSHSINQKKYDGYVDDVACKPYGPPPPRYQGALT